jgi:hypothetical protein
LTGEWRLFSIPSFVTTTTMHSKNADHHAANHSDCPPTPTTTTTTIKLGSQQPPYYDYRDKKNFNDSNASSSLRHMTGSWVGKNSWVPPRPWRLYSVREMQQLYHGRHILWMGDSTARRAAMVLHAILNATTTTTTTTTTIIDDVDEESSSQPATGATEQQHVSVAMLERDIDVNKMRPQESCDKWHAYAAAVHNRDIVAQPPFTICRPVHDGGGGEVAVLPINCVSQ